MSDTAETPPAQDLPAQDPSAIAVALTGWNPAPWVARFAAAAPGRRIIVAPDETTPLPPRYHLFCWKPSQALLNRTPAPLLIASAGAGVDHILKANPPPGVPISRVVDPDLTGRMVEYVVLHTLMHLRRMTEASQHQRARRWKSADFPPARAVTVGVMGVGEMGRAAAQGLMALGFTVIGWGRGTRQGLPFETYAGAEGLDAFLRRTDMLVNLLPSTPETRGLVNRALLEKLNRASPLGGAVFINGGRGDACNEAELAAALRDGALRSASLDVFVTEPLPADSPFWGMENVVLTPHRAADSTPDAVVAAVMGEIGRIEAGLAPLNPVDPVRGY